MTPETPYRLEQIERRLDRLEQRIEAMKYDAVLVHVNDCRDDISALDRRIGRMQWLLVTAIASVGGGAVIIALSVGAHP